jgi:hypothetical protein
MRSIRISTGEMVMAFLAADGRIYMLDDAASDTNLTPAKLQPTAASSGRSVQLVAVGSTIGRDGMPVSGRDGGTTRLLRQGMSVVVTKLVKGREVFQRQATITAITAITTTNVTIEIEADIDLTKDHGDFRFYAGVLPEMDIISTYVGAETMDTFQPDSVQMRFTSRTLGSPSFCAVSAITNDGQGARVVSISDNTYKDVSVPVGVLTGVVGANGAVDGPTSRREQFAGRMDAPEIAIRVQQVGGQPIQIADLALEV